MFEIANASFNPNVDDAVIFNNILPAPVIDFSSNGLWSANSVAFTALFSPSASPKPIIATPESSIVVLMSAKSRLIKPVFNIKSASPFIPIFNTLLASIKAFWRVIVFSGSSNSLSLGITISASTTSFKLTIPSSAFLILLLPSKLNGFVTTATVNMPISLATLAITGAAPVPVPPPIPEVMNNISVSSNNVFILSKSSSAASFPISGFAPAPKPLVDFSPN